MRPLPRVLAYTNDRVAALDDLGVRAAAIAAVGPAVALVARRPGGSADQVAALASRLVALAGPPMASVLVTGRIDIALATRAQGVILRENDLPARDVQSLGHPERSEGSTRDDAIPHFARDDTFILRSVHSLAAAAAAAGDGVDAIVVGTIWPTATHPELAAAGTALLADVVSLGIPTFAIGGVTAARAGEAAAAGAWGVAVISALWDAADPYQGTMELLRPWN